MEYVLFAIGVLAIVAGIGGSLVVLAVNDWTEE